MGSFGCKYCSWDKENTEGTFEQMLPDKTPIPVPILKTNNNSDLNNNVININDIITNIKNENIIKLSDGDELSKMIVGKALKKNKELFEDKNKEIEFSVKYQIV